MNAENVTSWPMRKYQTSLRRKGFNGVEGSRRDVVRRAARTTKMDGRPVHVGLPHQAVDEVPPRPWGFVALGLRTEQKSECQIRGSYRTPTVAQRAKPYLSYKGRVVLRNGAL